MSNELLRTRIGNTVTVVLPVLTRGDAVSLVGRDITIMLVDPNGTKTPVSFTIGGVSNNIATFVVEGTSQSATGTYRAEVYENYRGTAMAVYDCDIFVLVARTEYENDGNEGVSSETTTLDPINIAWVGRDGYTPYIQDGYWYINGTSTGVRALGENGDTPYIHEGYWYINGTSTGIKADYATEEAARAAAEIVRMNAELARAQAEQTRKDAEVSRSTNESGRSAAEGVRILAERDRQSEEAMRQTNEEIRTDNEEARVEAELGRAASEASRAQVEATRVANETARTTAEATRAANEQTRVADETDRAAAETARIANETARETAEDGRTSAEATRVSNEQTRVSNESTRQSNESARQSAETARQSAYTAAENARDAAFEAKEATRDAANQAALDCAETLAALGPKVDELNETVSGNDESSIQIEPDINDYNNVESTNRWQFRFDNLKNGDIINVSCNSGYLVYFGIVNNDATQWIEVYQEYSTGSFSFTFTDESNGLFKILVKNSNSTNLLPEDIANNVVVSVTRTVAAKIGLNSKVNALCGERELIGSTSPDNYTLVPIADNIEAGNAYEIIFSDVSANTSVAIAIGEESSSTESVIPQQTITDGKNVIVTPSLNATYWRVWKTTGECTVSIYKIVNREQYVDNVPKLDSTKLITSGGVFNALKLSDTETRIVDFTFLDYTKGLVNSSTGVVSSSNNHHYVRILVEGWKLAKFLLWQNSGSNVYGVAFFDANDTYIKGYYCGNSKPSHIEIVDIPSNASYLKYCYPISNFTPYMVLFADSSNDYVVGRKSFTSDIEDIVGLKKTIDLSSYVWNVGAVDATTGLVDTSITSLNYTSVPVKGYSRIQLRLGHTGSVFGMAFFDDSNNYINGHYNASGHAGLMTFTIPYNASYVLYSIAINSNPTFHFVRLYKDGIASSLRRRQDNTNGEAMLACNEEYIDTSFMGIVMLDNNYKYFSVAQIERIIDKMSSVGLNYLELGFGGSGYGLSFKLNDMTFMADDGKMYDISNCVSTGSGKYLDEEDMETLIEYAEARGVHIIPLFSSPSHMSAILSDYPEYCYRVPTDTNSARQKCLDIDNDDAVSFGIGVVELYAKWFAYHGCQYFNIGADEFYNVSTGYSELQAQGNYNYAEYINKLANMLARYRFAVMMWQDPICINNVIYPFINRKIIVNYWGQNDATVAAGVPLIKSQGYRLVNASTEIYWVVNFNNNVTESKMRAFNIRKFSDRTTISEQPYGAKFCIWIGNLESPALDDDGENITTDILPLIQAFGETILSQHD